MDVQTLSFVGLGTVAVILVVIFSGYIYNISTAKKILAGLLISVAGVPSVMLMYFFENGNFGGVSFFGGVFFVPIVLIAFSAILKIPYSDYLDLAAPSVCVINAVMKVNCLISGCCRGRVIGYGNTGIPIRFPSQIAEMVTCILITAFLIFLMCKKKYAKMIYPLFMVTYGFFRFILNFFRDTEDFLFGMAIGNFWSLIAIVIGVIWLIAVKRSWLSKLKK